MMKSLITTLMLTLGVNTALQAQGRLPTIPPDQYDTEQKQAADEFMTARKTPVFGPFEPLMHSPQLMSQARGMGDYLRYKSAIGTTLSELVILITAREWTQDYAEGGYQTGSCRCDCRRSPTAGYERGRADSV